MEALNHIEIFITGESPFTDQSFFYHLVCDVYFYQTGHLIKVSLIYFHIVKLFGLANIYHNDRGHFVFLFYKVLNSIMGSVGQQSSFSDLLNALINMYHFPSVQNKQKG